MFSHPFLASHEQRCLEGQHWDRRELEPLVGSKGAREGRRQKKGGTDRLLGLATFLRCALSLVSHFTWTQTKPEPGRVW